MAEELNPNPDKTQEARPCPKDCTKCGLQQHAFCSAQMSFYLVEKLMPCKFRMRSLVKLC